MSNMGHSRREVLAVAINIEISGGGADRFCRFQKLAGLKSAKNSRLLQAFPEGSSVRILFSVRLSCPGVMPSLVRNTRVKCAWSEKPHR